MVKYRLIHMSDIHMWEDDPCASIYTGLADLKRLQGYLNLKFTRGPNSFSPPILCDMFCHSLDTLENDRKQSDIHQHLIITGDITNISLEHEFKLARKFIQEHYLNKFYKKFRKYPQSNQQCQQANQQIEDCILLKKDQISNNDEANGDNSNNYENNDITVHEKDDDKKNSNNDFEFNDQNAWRYMTVIPGNHDTYVQDAISNDYFGKYFGDTLYNSNLKNLNACPKDNPTLYDRFPSIKILPKSSIIIVSLNTGVPTRLLDSSGVIGPEQFQKAEKMLSDIIMNDDSHQGSNYLKIILMHHPPITRSSSKIFDSFSGIGVQDKEMMIRFCKKYAIDLILNGHTHTPHITTLHETVNTIVCDPGSSTYVSQHDSYKARYFSYDIEEKEVGMGSSMFQNSHNGSYHPKKQFQIKISSNLWHNNNNQNNGNPFVTKLLTTINK